MAVCLLLTSCNDCSQFSTSALPIINLFNPPPPPSVCLSVVFNVSWVLQLSQEKLKEIILIPHSVLFLRPKVCKNCCFANASFFAGGGGGGGGVVGGKQSVLNNRDREGANKVYNGQ